MEEKTGVSSFGAKQISDQYLEILLTATKVGACRKKSRLHVFFHEEQSRLKFSFFAYSKFLNGFFGVNSNF